MDSSRRIYPRYSRAIGVRRFGCLAAKPYRTEMTESQRFLQRMIVSTINAREVESNRVSRLLHDEVGQVLSAVGLLMDVLRLDFSKQVPEITDRIREIQKMLDDAVEQV